MAFEHLLSPLKIGPKTTRNRVVFPCHGVELAHQFLRDNTDGDGYIAYQVARAKGGCGLNIIGPLSCHKTAMRGAPMPFKPPAPELLIPKLKKMSKALHDCGSLVLLQFWVFGNQYMSSPGNVNWGFTTLAAREECQEVCHEMDDSEINEIIDSYVEYSRVAQEGGMDGIEVHACHGDIVQQSWSPFINQRSDRWGKQMEFSTELAKRMRTAVGNDFIICFRITGDDFLPGGLDNEANQKVARELEATDCIDLFNVSFGNGGSSYSYTIGTMYLPPASISVPLTSGIRRAVKHTPVVACSRINDPNLAEKAIAEGHTDLVGIVRGQIADPEFVNKTREGRVDDIRLCIGCNQGCWDGAIGQLNCTQNVAAGKESTEYGTILPAPRKKKVMVIGGGPGGMEAARVAAIRGHKVTLYEREEILGGQVNTLAKAPGREEFKQVIRYLSTQLQKLGVEVKLGVTVTPDKVIMEEPDVVLVATGSVPYINPVPGSEQPNVVNPSQVLNGEVNVGESVIVYESTGLQEGPTTADFLAERGKRVELLTFHPNIAAYWGLNQMGYGSHIAILWPKLKKNGVTITPFTTVKEISGSTVTIADVWTGEKRVIENVDTVVMATGYRPDDAIYRALKGKVSELYPVGDCYAPKRALDAIHSGYVTSFTI